MIHSDSFTDSFSEPFLQATALLLLTNECLFVCYECVIELFTQPFHLQIY